MAKPKATPPPKMPMSPPKMPMPKMPKKGMKG